MKTLSDYKIKLTVLCKQGLSFVDALIQSFSKSRLNCEIDVLNYKEKCLTLIWQPETWPELSVVQINRYPNDRQLSITTIFVHLIPKLDTIYPEWRNLEQRTDFIWTVQPVQYDPNRLFTISPGKAGPNNLFTSREWMAVEFRQHPDQRRAIKIRHTGLRCPDRPISQREACNIDLLLVSNELYIAHASTRVHTWAMLTQTRSTKGSVPPRDTIRAAVPPTHRLPCVGETTGMLLLPATPERRSSIVKLYKVMLLNLWCGVFRMEIGCWNILYMRGSTLTTRKEIRSSIWSFRK